MLDGAQRLQGVLSLRRLFAAPADVPVANIMHRAAVAVDESADQKEVARVIEQNNLLAVPRPRFGSIAGSMLPFVLRRLGLDAATRSALSAATLVDVIALVLYFTVAANMLSGTIL